MLQCEVRTSVICVFRSAISKLLQSFIYFCFYCLSNSRMSSVKHSTKPAIATALLVFSVPFSPVVQSSKAIY